MDFRITADVIDPSVLLDGLRDARTGACVTFDGRVRDHNDGRAVHALEYEAYGLLAESEGQKIISEALAKFEVAHAVCVHRTGALALGDIAVWVAVSASHRAPAFDACRYIIDQVKARVPIWKKEHYADGASGWVNCATGGPR